MLHRVRLALWRSASLSLSLSLSVDTVTVWNGSGVGWGGCTPDRALRPDRSRQPAASVPMAPEIPYIRVWCIRILGHTHGQHTRSAGLRHTVHSAVAVEAVVQPWLKLTIRGSPGAYSSTGQHHAAGSQSTWDMGAHAWHARSCQAQEAGTGGRAKSRGADRGGTSPRESAAAHAQTGWLMRHAACKHLAMGARVHGRGKNKLSRPTCWAGWAHRACGQS